ncbi:hypothetical protein ACFRAR_30340 [Kitasatospora sp. NPDC056651]|uniref:hypothetical protein n=1 Tax=Kitasatospora sp. NPDC056651 TaxID=3345892 RepID=UPI00367A3A8C
MADFAGRHHACVHVLLSVMDGFVNEFTGPRWVPCVPKGRTRRSAGTALVARGR